MKRPLKYPIASIVGTKFGRRSQAYRMVYALEQWAARHGYEGRQETTAGTLTQGLELWKIMTKEHGRTLDRLNRMQNRRLLWLI